MRNSSQMPKAPRSQSYVPPAVHNVLRSPGRPLGAATRSEMEPRFGHDFSQVRVHTDSLAAESAKAVNALAYTSGNKIVFGAGAPPHESDSGRKLLAHELTHVVQQNRVQAAPSRIGQPGDVFEREADGVSIDVSAGKGLTRQLTPAGPMLQRFQIEGPFDVNDPVHETITEEALRKAGLLKPGQNYKDPAVWEYIRGVLWNDDPEGLLFDSNKKKTDDYSSGLEWTRKFKGAEKQAAKGTQFGPTADLIPRSHFGDLQFIHGMAAVAGEKAAVTQGKVLLWAEFTYKVAIGQIAGNTKIGNVGVAGIPELLPRFGKQTVAALFGIENIGDVQKRAAGSLLHMIQDSYASGHTEREKLPDGKKGRIISFHSYAQQDHDKHGHDDAFQGKGSDVQKLGSVPGARDAVNQSAQVLKFIIQRVSWEAVKFYLELEVFGTVTNPLPAGTGKDYLRKGTPGEPAYQLPGILPDAGDYKISRGSLKAG